MLLKVLLLTWHLFQIKRGGGIGIFVSENVDCAILNSESNIIEQQLNFVINARNSKLLISVVYRHRPPKSSVLDFVSATLLEHSYCG